MKSTLAIILSLFILSGCSVLQKRADRIYIDTEDGSYVFMRKHENNDGEVERLSVMTYERTLPTSIGDIGKLPEDVQGELRDTFSSVAGFQDNLRRETTSKCGVFMLPDIPNMPPLPESTAVIDADGVKSLELLGMYVQLLRKWGEESHRQIREEHYKYLERCVSG